MESILYLAIAFILGMNLGAIIAMLAVRSAIKARIKNLNKNNIEKASNPKAHYIGKENSHE